MNREMVNGFKQAVAFKIQAITTNTTTDGEIIDTQGFDSLSFLFQTGIITDGDYAVLIQHGEDSGLSDAADVADADLTVTEASVSFTADSDDDKVSKIGYTGAKRFVRFSVVSANTSTGGTVGAQALSGHPDVRPQA